MGKPAARLTDLHLCPMVTPGLPPIPHVGGPITGTGASTVLIGGMPAAVMSDMCTCVGPTGNVTLGSSGVFFNGKPAARMGDTTAHGGVITTGLPTVTIGESNGGASSGGLLGMPVNVLLNVLENLPPGAMPPVQQIIDMKNAAETGEKFVSSAFQGSYYLSPPQDSPEFDLMRFTAGKVLSGRIDYIAGHATATNNGFDAGAEAGFADINTTFYKTDAGSLTGELTAATAEAHVSANIDHGFTVSDGASATLVNYQASTSANYIHIPFTNYNFSLGLTIGGGIGVGADISAHATQDPNSGRVDVGAEGGVDALFGLDLGFDFSFGKDQPAANTSNTL